MRKKPPQANRNQHGNQPQPGTAAEEPTRDVTQKIEVHRSKVRHVLNKNAAREIPAGREDRLNGNLKIGT
jgi:hypothetical protein